MPNDNSTKMKEPNLSLMAYNLLNAATALAGILDWRKEGCVKVNFEYAVELIHAVQISAKVAADELMFIHYEEGGAK